MKFTPTTYSLLTGTVIGFVFSVAARIAPGVARAVVVLAALVMILILVSGGIPALVGAVGGRVRTALDFLYVLAGALIGAALAREIVTAEE